MALLIRYRWLLTAFALAALTLLPGRASGEILIDFSPDAVGGSTGTSFYNEIGVQVIADQFTLTEDAVLTGGSIYSQAYFPTEGLGTEVHFRIYSGTSGGPTLGVDPIIDILTQVDAIDDQGAMNLPGDPHTRKHASIPDTPLPAGTYWFAMPSSFGSSDVRQSGVTSNPYDDSILARGTDQLTVIDPIGDMWFQIEGRYEPGGGDPGGGDPGGGDPGGGDPGGGDPGGGDPGGGDPGNNGPVAPTPRSGYFVTEVADIGPGALTIAIYQDEDDRPDQDLFTNGYFLFDAVSADAKAPHDGSGNLQAFAHSRASAGAPFDFFTVDSPQVTVKSEAFAGPSEPVPGAIAPPDEDEPGSYALASGVAVDYYQIGGVSGLVEPISDVDLDMRLAIGGSLAFTGDVGDGYAKVRIFAATMDPMSAEAFADNGPMLVGKDLFEAVAIWDGQELKLHDAEILNSDWADASFVPVMEIIDDTVNIEFELIYEDLYTVDGGDIIGLYLFLETQTYVREGVNAYAHADFLDTVIGDFTTDHPDGGFRSIPEPSSAVVMVLVGGVLLRRRTAGHD